MISFDLKCADGHVFEAWFKSSEAYEDQRGGRLIGCPVCGNADIGKAVMAPAVAAKGNRRVAATAKVSTEVQAPAGNSAPAANVPSDAQLKALVTALAQAQAAMLETSQWVGDDFADQARAMHYGEAEQAPIHGTTNAKEARAMLEEGLPVAPLIVPVVPPGTAH